MSTGKSIPVWFTDEDRHRVEEAAALGGYKHLSKYLRDKALGRCGHSETSRDSMEAWTERQELIGRLAEIERNQKATHALLSMLLSLVRNKATTGEVNALVLACENSSMPTDILDATSPDLAASLRRLTTDE
ncbi:conjugal transfer protein TraA [Burkholderia ubonensis]|uniref:conjugal transfer protein TraA n=1 Tax=Burkholderia ubonensis TaxID=101571 RepID=UPI000F57203C|nr:conjugal transfer protein TraA [Burkholderia ubonensis]RQP38377.1 conjugal transfer protein TraA [Burkholderia ubonensis]RQP38696.1 conjugal transfer protein TraA [Burkholderia ubonensis]RQP42833.1 conjugal transfer protein TraA [Burkholderia ubonensis]RQP57231.1 conjugal transfer protein TraA [Burkholderia ubonensis]RQP62147.1 conjugal transfer protein TraA [Burkholderia ubonensis]